MSWTEWRCTDCDAHGAGVLDDNAENAQRHADEADHLVNLEVVTTTKLVRAGKFDLDRAASE